MSEQNRNLALRVLSALFLFPTLVYVSWLGGAAFAAVCGVAAAICAAELIGMFVPLSRRDGFGVVGAGVIPFAPWWSITHAAGTYPEWIGLALAFAVIVLLVVSLLRGGDLERVPVRVSATALGWLYCGFLVGSVVALRLRFGFGWAILAFVVTWLNDTFAYFAGRFFGKHRMLPRVSPKKTWEGFAGGMAGSVAGALLVLALKPYMPADPEELRGLTVAGCVLLGLVAGVLGPVGDLAESMLKRAAGVKDSGKLIPGHGGLLDRIDALLFVGPWVYAFAALAAARG
jgi:phosphatidate cytidylyltransferase